MLFYMVSFSVLENFGLYDIFILENFLFFAES